MADAVADREEDVWKEKFEELKSSYDALALQFDQFRAGVASGAITHDHPSPDFGFPGQGGISSKPVNGKPAIGENMAEWFEKFPAESLEATYQYIRKRMREENPQDLLMLMENPKLQVKTTRPVISVDAAGSLFGRICQLTAEGFFTSPQSAKVATAEAVRRGWCHPKTPFMRLADPLDKLAGMGFLTREADGYMAVSGVKIKIEDA